MSSKFFTIPTPPNKPIVESNNIFSQNVHGVFREKLSVSLDENFNFSMDDELSISLSEELRISLIEKTEDIKDIEEPFDFFGINHYFNDDDFLDDMMEKNHRINESGNGCICNFFKTYVKKEVEEPKEIKEVKDPDLFDLSKTSI